VTLTSIRILEAGHIKSPQNKNDQINATSGNSEGLDDPNIDNNSYQWMINLFTLIMLGWLAEPRAAECEA